MENLIVKMRNAKSKWKKWRFLMFFTIFNKRAAKGTRNGYCIQALNERLLTNITSNLRSMMEKGMMRRSFEEQGRRSNSNVFKHFRNEKGRQLQIREKGWNRGVTIEMEGRWEMKWGGFNEIISSEDTCNCNQPYLLMKKTDKCVII